MFEFNELQSEALKEILNMGAGRAAASLEALIGEHFVLNVPSVSLLAADDLDDLHILDDSRRAIMLGVKGDLNGFTSMVFSMNSARQILANTLDDEISLDEMDILTESTLMELGNVVVGAIVGEFANQLQLGLQYSSPTLLEGSIKELATNGALGLNPQIIVAKVSFTDSTGQTEGYFMTIFDVGSMSLVLPAIDGYLEAQGLL